MNYFTISILCLTALLTGCAVINTPLKFVETPLKAYHLADRSTVSNEYFDLCFVEFDDQGEWYDGGTQLQNALKVVKQTVEKGERPIVVFFAHGWENNAKPGNNNLGQFTNLLSKIANTDFDEENAKEKSRVIGIYLGWRGKASWIPWLSKPFTYYPRKSAGHRVGGPTATFTISRIVNEARKWNTPCSNRPPSRTVAIGHSFGAVVLEDALNEAFSSFLADQRLLPPVDALILSNPANNSNYARQLMEAFEIADDSKHEYLQENKVKKNGDESPRPIIFSISSNGDWATGLTFPIGQEFFTGYSSRGHLRTYRYKHSKQIKYNQGHFFRHTPPHNRYLLTHKAVPASIPKVQQLAAGLPKQFTDNYTKLTENYFAIPNKDKSNFYMELKPTESPMYRGPYWVIKVPQRIICSHNDVWNDSLQALCGTLLRLAWKEN